MTEGSYLCDGCGKDAPKLIRVILDVDFFGRPYDKFLKVPKHYCELCSKEKTMERDYKSIKIEFEKKETNLKECIPIFERAMKRIEEIERSIKDKKYGHFILKHEDVSILCKKMKVWAGEYNLSWW